MPPSREELIANYASAIRGTNNEAAKKEIFITLLSSLFGGRDEGGVIAQFAAGAERGVSNIRREGRRSGHGRADTLYGNVLIEFENNLRRTGARAEQQLKEYLSGLWNSGQRGRFTLIATDCLAWRVYSLDYDSLAGLGDLDADRLCFHSARELIVSPEEADQFYFFLDRCLFGSEPIPATLASVRERFGGDSDTFQSALALMREALARISGSADLETAKSQWGKFLSTAYGRFDASERFFLTHSYLSALAKLLAYAVISGDSGLAGADIGSVIDGSAFKKLNIANFTDNDFFRWTARDDPGLRRAFEIIADEIAALDFSDIPDDLLKGVYQELVDDDTRHALGEHYTPDWLCAKITAEMDPKPGQKILDPSCGSGSFLKAAANHLIKKKPDISAAELNAALHGIDAHPLSVQISKATLLMAYGKRLAAEPAPLSLNVFLANSLLLPDEDIQLMGGICTVAIDGARVSVPKGAFADQAFFARLARAAESYAETDFQRGGSRKPEELDRIFTRRLGLDGMAQSERNAILRASREIYAALLAAKESGRDGIWAYILANSYAPFALKGQFDLILGNPPWLAFRHIAAKDYQDEIKAIARKTNCIPEQKNLMPQLELASVFAAWSVNYFLRDGGRLAFVMPRSVFAADQHHKLRAGEVKNLHMKSLWDLREVSPLFKVPACAIFCERAGAQNQGPLAGKILKGSLACQNAPADLAEDEIKERGALFHLAIMGQRSAWSEEPLNMAARSPYFQEFANGATLIPRRLCFVEFDQEITGSLKKRLIRVKSSKAVKKDAKEPWRSLAIAGALSSEYLFATALANNLAPFALNGWHMAALPLKKGAAPNKALITPAWLEAEGELETAKWFQLASNMWEKHKTETNKNISFNAYLNWQSKLVKQNSSKRYLVLFTKSGANAVSAVIDREDFELPFVAENITYWRDTESREEAHYLCAFFNSAVPNQLIKPFQARGLYGARDITKKILELPLPRFDPKEAAHQELAALALQASAKAAAFIAGKIFDRYGNNMGARECGLFRKQVRDHARDEINEIDRIIRRLLRLE